MATDRYTTEIIANDMQMLSGRDEGTGSQAPSSRQNYPQGRPQQPAPQPVSTNSPETPPLEDFDDDIPF